MSTYHISQHSWYKLRDGKPVKSAVVSTLRRRFALTSGIASDAVDAIGEGVPLTSPGGRSKARGDQRDASCTADRRVASGV